MAAGRSVCNGTDLQLIERGPKDRISVLVHGFLDEMCGHNILRFQDFSKVWNIEEWNLLKSAWTSCLFQFVKDNLSIENIEKHLESFAISRDTQKIIGECLRPRKDEIKLALIEKTCSLSQATLKDFDWKLKLIMATDKLANMREPVLSLDLDIKENTGIKQLSVELTKGELKEMITSLEAANKVVMTLKR